MHPGKYTIVLDQAMCSVHFNWMLQRAVPGYRFVDPTRGLLRHFLGWACFFVFGLFGRQGESESPLPATRSRAWMPCPHHHPSHAHNLWKCFISTFSLALVGWGLGWGVVCAACEGVANNARPYTKANAWRLHTCARGWFAIMVTRTATTGRFPCCRWTPSRWRSWSDGAKCCTSVPRTTHR